MIENKPKNYKSMVWVSVAIIAVLIMANSNTTENEQPDEPESSLLPDKTSETFSQGERIKYPYPGLTNGTNNTELDVDEDGSYDLDDYEELTYGDYADYGYYGEHGYPEQNACGYMNYGYPAYIGTQKDGKTCTDTVEPERDMECLANTPLNYDGLLNKWEGTSKPKITCCAEDGTCQW